MEKDEMAGHVARMGGDENFVENLLGKLEGRRPF
jgi:hypothetical protein